MQKLIAALGLAVSFALVTGTPALAEEKLLGTVTRIEAQGDGAVATLKDSKSGQLVDVTVKDKVTLDKFKDHRISVGDEIKCKYEAAGGKNVATYFKKAAGC
jgi:hypothetical protein